ncbi:acyl-CoA thioesterase [Pseudomonas schmalbachii]|uniref:Acyl-CoA thioesterase n=1 Tax=Pseudomonas schmalbachii TaxID=2816993 RepID=A0ABS3TK73_9PSED|nr:thioesterase family protein [Pseudomonas schmalbachii]MBO3274062.1 acyl-CoA thioesterase [Pseudomonas schmalbachii]
MKPAASSRDSYRHFLRIPTRWMDNDVYGHVNNVNYYSYFDTVVNEYLMRAGVLDFERGETIGLVVETRCNYFRSIAFPDVIDAGLRVARLGSSSVRYEIGLFREGEDEAAAQGHFVHVYVDRESRRPKPLPEAMRGVLDPLVVDQA